MSKNNALYLATIAFSLGWLYFNFQALSAPVDCGDGLMHFFISQASWEDPTFFLDHWGKPLFTLLSSPFAQFGFGGIILFNALVFLITVLVGWQILKKLNTTLPVQLLFPLLLLLTPDYANNILGGLTEPLFGLFLVLACWAWIEDKFMLFALFAGATLFLRSEGQLVMLFALALLLLAKQWKSIFFLVVPFIVYAFIGLLALDDFWWYFTKSPYSMDNSFYGVGSYWHYINEFKSYLGIHGLAIAWIGFSGVVYYFFKKKLDFKLFGLIVLSYGTFLGIIAAHSYFYGSGQNGSMGLTRIATQGLPAFLIVNLYFFGALINPKTEPMKLSAYLFPSLMVFLLCTTPYLKKGENRINNTLIAMGDFIKQEPLLKNKTIYAYHPLLAYALESNLKMKNQRLQQFSGLSFLEDKSRLQFGDAIVWDSQFGPYEISIPLENFLQDSNLMLCKQETIPGDLDYNGVYLFQFVPAEIKRNNHPSKAEKILLQNKTFTTKDEFVDVLDLKPSKETYLLKATSSTTENVHLVCVPNDNSDYQAIELNSEEKTFEFTVKRGLPYKIYLWNPDKKNYTLTIKSLVDKRTKLANLWNSNAK
jgi:hypothetical protein